MMMIQKIKIAVLVCFTLLVLAGATAAVVMMNETEQQAVKTPPAPAPLVEPVPPDGAWRERFIEAYRLADGQILKLVPPPFIPERGLYFQSVEPARSAQYPQGPDVLVFTWDSTNPPGRRRNGFGMMGAGQPLNTAVWMTLGIQSHELDVPEALQSFKFHGDWVVAQNASPQEILEALCRMMKEAGGPSVRFTQQDRTNQVLVATGAWRNLPLPEGAPEIPVNVFVDQPDPPEQPQPLPFGGPTRPFVDHLASRLGMRAEIRVARPNAGGSYRMHSSVVRIPRDPGPERDEQIQKVLNVVSQQTDLRFTVEERKVKVWVAEEVPSK